MNYNNAYSSALVTLLTIVSSNKSTFLAHNLFLSSPSYNTKPMLFFKTSPVPVSSDPKQRCTRLSYLALCYKASLSVFILLLRRIPHMTYQTVIESSQTSSSISFYNCSRNTSFERNTHVLIIPFLVVSPGPFIPSHRILQVPPLLFTFQCAAVLSSTLPVPRIFGSVYQTSLFCHRPLLRFSQCN